MTVQSKLPASITVLDTWVVAEHPQGHRVIGKVVGAGTRGVALHAFGFTSTVYVSYERGWSVQPTDEPSRESS